MKPILLLDFDGVIHSCSSGWKGARTIQDAPVEGALEFIVKAQEVFKVCIYSSRSRQFGGKRAMRKWLKRHYFLLGYEYEKAPQWLLERITKHCFADPWEDDARWEARRIVSQLKFPVKKPAAFLTIDDRAICFDGVFPDPEKLLEFKPWNKKGV